MTGAGAADVEPKLNPPAAGVETDVDDDEPNIIDPLGADAPLPPACPNTGGPGAAADPVLVALLAGAAPKAGAPPPPKEGAAGAGPGTDP